MPMMRAAIAVPSSSADGGDEDDGVVDRTRSADRDDRARTDTIALQAGGDAIDPRVERGIG